MSYEELTDEQAERVYSVQRMPPGQSAVAAAEALVTDAERSGSDVFIAWAASVLATELNDAGETHRALVPIARLTQLVGSNPSRFAPYLVYSMLWSLKHVLSVLTEDPSNSTEVIAQWLDEADRRLLEHGYSVRPVYEARARLALEQGRYADAEEFVRQMVTAERDDLADCVTCEEHFFGNTRSVLGDEDGAMHHWRRVMSGELEGCRWEPDRSRARFLTAGVRHGAFDEVVSAHVAGVASARRAPGLMVVMANQIEFCALTHNEARGVEIANDYRLTYDASGADRAEYLASLALLSRRLVETGFGDTEVRDIDGTLTPAVELAVSARAATEALIAQFEGRDGPDGARVRRLRARLDATPIIDHQLPLGLGRNPTVLVPNPQATSTVATEPVGATDGGTGVTPGPGAPTGAPIQPEVLVELARSRSRSAAPSTDDAWMKVIPHRDRVDLTEAEGLVLDLLSTGAGDWARRSELAARLHQIGATAAATRIEAKSLTLEWWKSTSDGVEAWLRVAGSRIRLAAATPDDLRDVLLTNLWLIRAAERIPHDVDGVASHLDELHAEIGVAGDMDINPSLPAELRLQVLSAPSREEYEAAAAAIAQHVIDAAGNDPATRADGMRMAFTYDASPDDLDQRYAAIMAIDGATPECRLRTMSAYADHLASCGRLEDSIPVARQAIVFAQSAVVPDAVQYQYRWADLLGWALNRLDREHETIGVLESFVATIDSTQVLPNTYVDVMETLANAYANVPDSGAEEVELRIRVAQFADEFGSTIDRFHKAMGVGYALNRAERPDDARNAFGRAEELADELDYVVGVLDARYGAATTIEDAAERATALEELRRQVVPLIEPMRSDPDQFDSDPFLTWMSIQSALFAARDVLIDDDETADAAIAEGLELWRTTDQIAPDALIARNGNILVRTVVLLAHSGREREGRELLARMRRGDLVLDGLDEWFDDTVASPE